MKRLVFFCVVMILLAGLTGCSKSAEPNVAPTGQSETVGNPGSTPAVQPGNAATDLAGSTWQIDEFTVSFKNPPDVFVKGGPLGEAGTAGTYKVDNGIIQISAAGQTKAGTWNGTKLVIEGIDGVRQ